MYKNHFRIDEMPFSIAPNPRFLFMSERHREALAHLLYGTQGEGGIVLLTGEIGTGKTTICRSLLDQLPENIDVALILNPRMSVEELLQTICEEFHIEVTPERPGIKTFIDALNAKLLAAHALGRRAILIVDEAQNLDPPVLEQLRLLTNLETSTHKLLQIFLIGQPELQDMLSKPEMRQVSQRIIARYHLTHLSQPEVHAYIAHRLKVSGASPLIFPDSLSKQVYRSSGGVPRLINLICDRALLGAYTQGEQQVSLPVLRQAANEVLAANPQQQRSRGFVMVVSTLMLSAAILLGAQLADTKFDWSQSWFAHTPPAQSEPAPRPADLPTVPLKWPSNIPLAQSERLAFQSLLKLYGIDYDMRSTQAPCQQAEAMNKRCYDGHGGLSDLLKLDQPVVLKLSTPDGKEYAATLTALNHKTASLLVGGAAQRVSLNDLANSWLGKFIAVWNAPPNFNGELSPNQRGAAVIWLRHAMEAVDGIHERDSDVFDAALAGRIRAFQLREGMQPDGLVGPLTVIRLNARNGKTTPHLVSGREG